MLEQMRKGQQWLTWIFVIAIGGVFVLFMGGGFGAGSGPGPAGDVVVALEDFRYTASDFGRLRTQQEEMFRQRLGERFDPKTAASFLDSQTLQLMVESAVMAESARELGLRVTRQEIQRLVRSTPTFRNESGKFDPERFEEFARWEYGSQKAFLGMMRQDLLRQKMVGLLFNQASLSEGEARDAALYALEEARIAYVKLDTQNLPGGEGPDEAAISAHLEANREALRATYDERSLEWAFPEQSHGRHILVRFDPEDKSDARAVAEKQINEARARIEGGEDFAAVAREVSQDPGTREEGGDLGFLSRGEHHPRIEEALFGLEPGTVSEVIETDGGLHIVQVEERRPAGTRSFDEVAPELAREAVERAAAARAARAAADALAAAVAGGQSLEDAARERELTLERTAMLKRRPDGFIPGLGGSPELLDAAFALDMAAASSDRIFEVGPNLVLIQLLERSTPDAETIEQTVSEQRDMLLSRKRQQVIEEWIAERRSTFEESGRLTVNPGLVIGS